MVSPSAVARAMRALHLVTDHELGQVVGVSRRTIVRRGRHGLNANEKIALAKAVLPHDRAVSAELAIEAGTSHEALGWLPPPAPVVVPPSPPPPDPRLVDGVLCATAEALNLSPGVVRPALLIAMQRMRELGLDLDTVEAALTPAVARSTKT